MPRQDPRIPRHPTLMPKYLWCFVLYAVPGFVFFPLACALHDFGEGWGTTTALDTVDTPDQTLRAWVVNHDAGALGGSTTIWVEHIPSRDRAKVLHRNWMGHIQLSWVPTDEGWRLAVPKLMESPAEYELEWPAFRRIESLQLGGVQLKVGPG